MIRILNTNVEGKRTVMYALTKIKVHPPHDSPRRSPAVPSLGVTWNARALWTHLIPRCCTAMSWA